MDLRICTYGRPSRTASRKIPPCRVHPGETPAQFIIHGVIDFLAGESSRARALRANVVFKITPMLNPDGEQQASSTPIGIRTRSDHFSKTSCPAPRM